MFHLHHITFRCVVLKKLKNSQLFPHVVWHSQGKFFVEVFLGMIANSLTTISSQ